MSNYSTECFKLFFERAVSIDLFHDAEIFSVQWKKLRDKRRLLG
jgi:hypothetical protein